MAGSQTGQLACTSGPDGEGACLWGVTPHLYRSVLYFANLLLCSAAILPKERGFENQENSEARNKQREETPSDQGSP